MGWGIVYEVPADASSQFTVARTKGEWYDTLGRIMNGKCLRKLDAEDSIRFWGAKLEGIGHPLSRFFIGDLHAEYDEYDDPNVCFIGPELARDSLKLLEQLGEQYFQNLFPPEREGVVGNSWFYTPLCRFLIPLCERGNAVVLLWES